MLPNMKRALKGLMQTVILRTTTQTIVNFQPVKTNVDTNIKAVVQVANDNTLQVNSLDFSKSYFTIHSETALKINDIVVYKGKELKVIILRDDSDYGFYKVIGEQKI